MWTRQIWLLRQKALMVLGLLSCGISFGNFCMPQTFEALQENMACSGYEIVRIPSKIFQTASDPKVLPKIIFSRSSLFLHKWSCVLFSSTWPPSQQHSKPSVHQQFLFRWTLKDVSDQMTFDQRTFGIYLLLVHTKADISLALSVCLEIEKGIHAFMEVERELISSMTIP